METLTIHPQNDGQLKAIKAVLKALGIPFEKEKGSYNDSFVKKIKDAEKERENSIMLNNDLDIDRYFKSLEKDVQD